jgi:hypothetical protein
VPAVALDGNRQPRDAVAVELFDLQQHVADPNLVALLRPAAELVEHEACERPPMASWRAWMLLDGHGDVLGLADLIETGGTARGAEGQSAGIGFATPTVANVAHRIIAGRPVARLPRRVAQLGLRRRAEAASVQSTSPAAKVSLEPRDLITAVTASR